MCSPHPVESRISHDVRNLRTSACKIKAAGPGGKIGAAIAGNQRLDALSNGDGRATEVDRSGSRAKLDAAANRLKKIGAA